MLKYIPILFIYLLSINKLVADTYLGRTAEGDTSKQKPYSLVALPLIAFTPETDWIFGGAGSLSFRFKGELPKSRPSQLLMGGAYTLKKQILSYLTYQLFFKQEQYKFYGELGYYLYTYPYFGIGNDLEEGNLENYEALFPRIRLNGLYLLHSNFYGGLRYWMDDFQINEKKGGGLIEEGDTPGAEGGLLSGLGFVFNYDSRDHIFYPSKGKFAELVFLRNAPFLGSDFIYTKYSFDASTYFFNKWKHILAFNLYTELTFGTAPFNQLALLGGTKKMRGYIEGRFRDKHLIVFQTEYRLPLFWRFGAVIFAGTGRVANKISQFNFDGFHYNFGTGLRFLLDKKEKMNLRFDVGFGKGTSGFYLTFGEAF